MKIKFRMGEMYSVTIRKDVFYLTDHPVIEDIKVVHFKLPNGVWDVVYYPNKVIEKNFDKKIWVKIDELFDKTATKGGIEND